MYTKRQPLALMTSLLLGLFCREARAETTVSTDDGTRLNGVLIRDMPNVSLSTDSSDDITPILKDSEYMDNGIERVELGESWRWANVKFTAVVIRYRDGTVLAVPLNERYFPRKDTEPRVTKCDFRRDPVTHKIIPLVWNPTRAEMEQLAEKNRGKSAREVIAEHSRMMFLSEYTPNLLWFLNNALNQRAFQAAGEVGQLWAIGTLALGGAQLLTASQAMRAVVLARTASAQAARVAMQEAAALEREALVANAVARQLAAALGEAEGDALLRKLQVSTLQSLLTTLTPHEVREFVALLGEKEVERLLKTFGVDVMKHYGPTFFKRLPTTVEEELMSHVIRSEGIWDGEIHGCHDQARFLQALNGQGKILSSTPMPGHPEIVAYRYQLYRKGIDGQVIQPVQFSTRVGTKRKTVIIGLEQQAQSWKQHVQQSLEAAVKNKTFSPAKKEFDFMVQGIEFRGVQEAGTLKTFFPKWRP